MKILILGPLTLWLCIISHFSNHLMNPHLLIRIQCLTRIWHLIMQWCSWWFLFIGSQCGFIVVDVIFYMGPWDQNFGNDCSSGTFNKEPCYIVCGEESSDDSGRSSSRVGHDLGKCMLLNITIPFELWNTCKAELITFCMWGLQINHSF